MASNNKQQKKAAQEAANKRTMIIVGIVVALILAAVVIGTTSNEAPVVELSANDQPTAPPPVDTPPVADEAPVADAPQAEIKHYDDAPPMTIDTDAQYFATVKMATGGEFVIELYPDKAPITVNSFVFLAREGYFDGVTFHRVLDEFMAQGGDPTGTGTSGPGYQFVNEDSDLTFDKAGVIAMANAGRDTNGSQFFITFGPTPQLNGGYTIFGQVIEGMDVVEGITRRDPQLSPNFIGDAIESVTIEEK